MLKIIIVSVLVLFNCNLYAQSGEGGEIGAFMKNGFGARASAMGNSFTAVSNDVSSIYYNPAGLSLLDKTQVLGMYSSLFNDVDGISYGNLAVAKPFSFGTIGLGVVYLNVGDIPYVPDNTGPDGTTFSDNEVAVFLTYSVMYVETLRMGCSIKFLNHSLADYSGSGVGFDIGFMSKFSDKLTFGLMFQDLFGASIKLNKDSDKYPAQVKFGASYKPVESLIISPQINFSEGKRLIFAVGTEYKLYRDYIYVRSGFNNLYNSWSAGLGLNYKDVKLDYSYNIHKDLGSVNKFGFVIGF